MGNAAPNLGIAEIAAGLSLNKTTVYRLLAAMEKFGLVEKVSDSDRYRLGLKLHELGSKAIQSRNLRQEAHPFLVDLALKSGESVHLAVPGARGAVCLDDVESSTKFMVRTPIGSTFEPHCSAIGKAVVAFLDEAEIDRLLSSCLWTKYTVFTRTSPEEIKKNLREVVRLGYALDCEETEVGISCIAVPLHSTTTGIAAVGMSGLTNRFKGIALKTKILLLKETAAQIAERLRS